MDIKAFKRWCLNSFDEVYLEKLKKEQGITFFDYIEDKNILTAKKEFLENSHNMQPNEVVIDKIIEADMFLGMNNPAIVDEGKIIGLLESLGDEMGDDYCLEI